MKKLSVELSEETFEWLRATAEANHRSVSGQIRFFLDQECLTSADNKNKETES